MNQLKQFGIIPFSTGTLKLLLSNYKSPNDKISELMASGEIMQIKKGMYIVSSEYRNQNISKEILANLIYGPSYVSLDFALSYYGMIPERVMITTSITPKRSKIFSTLFGEFTYTHSPINYYHIGISQEKNENQFNFLIASPEKALCDKIVFTKKLNLYSVSSMRYFLFDDLRIDFQNIKKLDLSIIEECIAVGPKQNELKLLLKTIKKSE
ncbi:MAG: hypothetical protein A3F72_05145 [Bacteroidetes bacterium RIFCSPLOWO2_12_FULL_35_15]|nr:MAG: hypothetical protein A3F72_05145 [Bacteroidetes bacterium RIFCSPLOWO2_12_FULL_35_15]